MILHRIERWLVLNPRFLAKCGLLLGWCGIVTIYSVVAFGLVVNTGNPNNDSATALLIIGSIFWTLPTIFFTVLWKYTRETKVLENLGGPTGVAILDWQQSRDTFDHYMRKQRIAALERATGIGQ